MPSPMNKKTYLGIPAEAVAVAAVASLLFAVLEVGAACAVQPVATLASIAAVQSRLAVFLFIVQFSSFSA